MKKLAVSMGVSVLVLILGCKVMAAIDITMKAVENSDHEATVFYEVLVCSEKRECDGINITFLVTNPKGDVKYIDQVPFPKTGDSENYVEYSKTFEIIMDDKDPTGTYTVKCRYMENDKYTLKTQTFSYLSKSDREAYINIFNKDPLDNTEVKNALTRNRTSFINMGFLYNMYSRYIQNNTVLFDLFIKAMNVSRPNTGYNEKSLPETFNSLSVLVPINNSDIEDFAAMIDHANLMFNYEIMPIDSEIYDLDEGVKDDIYLKVYNSRPFNSVAGIRETFEGELLKLKPQKPDTDDKNDTGGGSSGKPSNIEIVKGADEGEENKVIKQTEIKPMNKFVFSDVSPEHWAYEAIDELYNRGIINGRGEGIFSPNDNITREEFVKMLVGALAYDITSTPVEFKDVENSAWYFPYISTAYHNKLIYGRSPELFGIGEYITRQDVAVILHRALEESFDIASIEYIPTDINEASEYAQLSIQSLYSYGIINGYEDGTFRPLQNVTRAEVAVLVYRIIAE